jgi:hypothetical protein
MSDEAGAYIWKDGVLLPDLDDEAMAARQVLTAEEITEVDHADQ